jgi:predicted DNA binding CopG/RHH family protein
MEKLPEFKSAAEEAEFWETHSPLDFADQFEEVKEPIVDRRGRKKGIYIRVDPEVITAARSIGGHLGIGYQTLFRMWIMEGLSRHLTQALREPGAATVNPGLQEFLGRMPPDRQRLLLVLLEGTEDLEGGERWTSQSSRVPSRSE